MNKESSPKPLAKALSVVIKNVHKGAVWSQMWVLQKCCRMNNEIPPKPLAKALSGEMKNVRTVVWSQARSAVKCNSPEKQPSVLPRKSTKLLKCFCFVLTNVKCNYCLCFGSGAVVTTGFAEFHSIGMVSRSLWGLTTSLENFPLKYICQINIQILRRPWKYLLYTP